MTTPHAVYRLQLRPGFGFAEAAAEAAGYLAALGVSHVMCSPILAAAPGSQHGYDVADPEQVNPELGGEEGFRRWCERLRALGLGQIVDIVPNHMTIATARNHWWWDVLRRGEASPYARYFDIDWGKSRQIVLPWLSRPLKATLAAGELKIGDGVLRYGATEFPLAPGSDSAGELSAVLARQHYRLAHWSVADHELPYRRFFDVSHLIGVRVEDPEVFAATHRRILEWLAKGVIDGVRVDHVDGLREPAAYLERLRAAAPRTWIVVEKILARGESLRPEWPVAGTTGYEFLNRAMGLLLAPAGAAPLEACYEAFTGPQPSFAVTALESQRQILGNLVHSELRWVSQMVRARRGPFAALRSLTPGQLDQALAELAVRYPVYRTYAPAGGPIAAQDLRVLASAHAAACAAEPARTSVYDALRALLERAENRAVLLRFQQLTPAVFAKGVEDTAFYRSFRLSALNEVGGDPGAFGTTLTEFHAACAAVEQHWPATLLATSTHDTKRGEDVRARLCLLAEIPEQWQAAALCWQEHNRRRHSRARPDANTEYLFYQTLVGAWPISAERMQAYLLKAVREAKAHTSWRTPDAAYENALRRFVAAAMGDAEWMRAVEAFVRPLVDPGRVNSLTQVLLKMTAPGVPHLYNGTELWDMHLVDPDNRGAVDFTLRQHLLADLDPPPAPEMIWARRAEGLPKLWLIHRALQLRRARPEAFAGYAPLPAQGRDAGHVVAFTRGGAVAVIAPRLTLKRGPLAATLELPAGRWRNWLTEEMLEGGPQPVAALWARFPVVLLAREAA